MTYIVTFIFQMFMSALAFIGDSIGNSMLSLLTMNIGEDGSFFDIVFEAMGPFSQVIQIMAMAILMLSFMWGIIRIMYTQEGTGETPLQLVFTTIVAGIFIYMGPSLIRIFQNVFNQFYEFMLTMKLEGVAVEGNVSFDYMGAIVLGALGGTIAGPSGVTGGLVLADTLNGDFSLVALIFGAILMLLIVYEFLMFILEVVERYVVLGVLYYMAPLAFSLAGTKGTRNVFAAYVRMLGSQMFLMTTNVLFFRLFIHAQKNVGAILLNISTAYADQDISFTTITIVYFIVLFCILHVGSKVDSYLGTLGLNAAQTGRGLGAAMVATALGVRRTIGMATSAGKAFAGTKAGKAVGDTAKGVYDTARRTMSGNYGSKASGDGIADARSVRDAMTGVMCENDRNQKMKGSYGGGGLKTVLQNNLDSGITSGQVSRMNASSFKVHDNGFSIEMKGTDGSDSRIKFTKVSEVKDAHGNVTGYTAADGVNMSKVAGRMVDIDGQKAFAYQIGGTPEAAKRFATESQSMKNFAEQQNAMPGVTMNEVAPGQWMRTEVDKNNNLVSQQAFMDTRLYHPEPGAHIQNVGNDSFIVQDTTAMAKGITRADMGPDATSFSTFGKNSPELINAVSDSFSVGGLKQAEVDSSNIVSYGTNEGVHGYYAPVATSQISPSYKGPTPEVVTAANGAQYYHVAYANAADVPKADAVFQERPECQTTTVTLTSGGANAGATQVKMNFGIYATEKAPTMNMDNRFVEQPNSIFQAAETHRDNNQNHNHNTKRLRG